MNKIINYKLILFLLLLSSCAYEPILNSKNYEFSLKINNVIGDQKINSIIISEFKNLKKNRKQYGLSFTSTKEKNIISKDSKGDPAIFELIINVNYTVQKDGKTIIQNEINRKSSYNNITDKFELENYEKTIINNLSKNISDRIMYSISEIHE